MKAPFTVLRKEYPGLSYLVRLLSLVYSLFTSWIKLQSSEPPYSTLSEDGNNMFWRTQMFSEMGLELLKELSFLKWKHCSYMLTVLEAKLLSGWYNSLHFPYSALTAVILECLTTGLLQLQNSLSLDSVPSLEGLKKPSIQRNKNNHVGYVTASHWSASLNRPSLKKKKKILSM